MGFRLTLPNGITLEGDIVKVVQASSKLGYNNVLDSEVYHYSETKGAYVRIDEMGKSYLANAISKLFYRENYTPKSVLADLLTAKHMFALLTAYKKLRDKE